MAKLRTRSDAAIRWIEDYCLYPDGPSKGKRVRLSEEEIWQVRQVYDNPDGKQNIPVSGPLAAYLVLLHISGPEARYDDFMPAADVDVWTIWNATTADLRGVLTRAGEHVVCPALGKRWPVAA